MQAPTLATSAAPNSHAPQHAAPHAPAPSGWPILFASGFGALGTTLALYAFGVPYMKPLAALSFAWALFCAMGWASSIASDRRAPGADLRQSTADLTLGFYCFLCSEALVFASFFGYLFYRWFNSTSWPPAGVPAFATRMPAIGTLILVASSFTFNLGLHAFKRGKTSHAKNWILLTIAMGIAFLGVQGFEWGILHAYEKFTPQGNAFASLYYTMTGFHGLHVIVGLIMLSLVYWRLEKGEYNEKFHFSFKAAEYYWHFVDIVWVFLFFSIYLVVFAR